MVYTLESGNVGVIAASREEAAELINHVYADMGSPYRTEEDDLYRPMTIGDISMYDRLPSIVEAVRSNKFWIMAA